MHDGPRPSSPVKFDRFELDVERRRLLKDGQPVRVQPRPLLALVMLVKRSGSTVTRQELYALLWPGQSHGQFDAGLNTAIRKLRDALGDPADRSRFVQTDPGIGYRFIGLVDGAAVTAMPRTAYSWPTGRVRLTAAACLLIALAVVAPGLQPSSRLADAWAREALEETRLVGAGERTADAGYARARMAAEHALALNARLWRAHAALGIVSAEHDRDAAAAAGAFQRAVSTGASEPMVFTAYACALTRVKRPAEALAVIDRGLRILPRAPELRAHRGLLLHALGRYDEELATLQAVVADSPDSPDAHFHLGLGLARREQYDGAIAALRRAVSLSGGAPRFVSWLGRIAADAGRPADARSALEALRERAATRYVPADLIDSVKFHLSAKRG